MPEVDIGYPHARVQRPLPPSFRTIKNRLAAWELGREYYDGARENGYGGFRYDGRWREVIPNLQRLYGIDANSAVLDVGCKKGFFIHDLRQMLPGIVLAGVENHPYPLREAIPEVKPFLRLCPYEELPFEDGVFDFVLAFAAIYMLNLGGVVRALREIQRVGKGKAYVTLGAYETKEERDLFEAWTLLGATVLHKEEWLEVMDYAGYTGDYWFTSAKSLGLSWAPAGGKAAGA